MKQLCNSLSWWMMETSRDTSPIFGDEASAGETGRCLRVLGGAQCSECWHRRKAEAPELKSLGAWLFALIFSENWLCVFLVCFSKDDQLRSFRQQYKNFFLSNWQRLKMSIVAWFHPWGETYCHTLWVEYNHLYPHSPSEGSATSCIKSKCAWCLSQCFHH